MLGQLCTTLWDSRSLPVVTQPGIEPGSIVMPQALQCSWATQEANLLIVFTPLTYVYVWVCKLYIIIIFHSYFIKSRVPIILFFTNSSFTLVFFHYRGLNIYTSVLFNRNSTLSFHIQNPYITLYIFSYSCPHCSNDHSAAAREVHISCSQENLSVQGHQ